MAPGTDDPVETLARRAAADDACNRWWYELGRQVGRAEGYAAAEAHMAEEWSTLAARLRLAADEPTQDELRRRREEAA